MTAQELIAYNNGFILGLVSKGVATNSEVPSQKITENRDAQLSSQERIRPNRRNKAIQHRPYQL